ncbi:hypothetical protein CPB83DRAFT_864641, partial [Crepidotus variabilis]
MIGEVILEVGGVDRGLLDCFLSLFFDFASAEPGTISSSTWIILLSSFIFLALTEKIST